MSEDPKPSAEDPTEVAAPAPAPEPVVPPVSEPIATEPPAPPSEAPSPAAQAAALAAERPEVAVGAAFAGGLVAALILKRLAR